MPTVIDPSGFLRFTNSKYSPLEPWLFMILQGDDVANLDFGLYPTSQESVTSL